MRNNERLKSLENKQKQIEKEKANSESNIAFRLKDGRTLYFSDIDVIMALHAIHLGEDGKGKLSSYLPLATQLKEIVSNIVEIHFPNNCETFLEQVSLAILQDLRKEIESN